MKPLRVDLRSCTLRCEPRTEDVASLLRTDSQAGQFSKHALDQSVLRGITVQEMHEAKREATNCTNWANGNEKKNS